MDVLAIRRALLSVTRKDGLAELASFLHGQGVELVSTGGTMKFLKDQGLPVTAVSEVTGFPEILDGRVKTLNPRIHGGILADKDNPAHLATLAEHGITPFDLVCVNLYDFASALEKKLPARAMVEDIDIGGPCLLRASAKNYHSVLVLPDPACYGEAIALLKRGGVDLAFRQRMAARTFRITSRYDDMIAAWMESLTGAAL
ncbi:MAG: IMP cyclohydrolase [Desulfovibrionaceae bacterium]|nr:IMP cyclohydrolase [Desulfovibrionaceae bacterium]